MSDLLIRAIGWQGIKLQGDVTFLGRLAWLQAHLKSGPLKTLDAGCGRGAFTMLAARLGNDALGLTFSPEDAAIASRRAALVGAKSARFEVLDLRVLDEHLEAYGKFDQIICCEVIEHVFDDGKLVGNLAYLLNPGGTLYLTTPFAEHRPMYGEVVSEVEDGGHVRFGYTKARIDELLSTAGLSAQSYHYLNGWVDQKLFNVYNRLYRIHPKLGWAATIPLRPLLTLDRAITNAIGYKDLCIAVIATKS